jgi:DNA-directed RNA polymerase specialized sigma24 family protein
LTVSARGVDAEGAGVGAQVRALLCDRHSPETAALFEVLSRFTHRRVVSVGRACHAQLTAADEEELVGDVLLALLQGALAGFRGDTLPELFAFVRTITDRTTWRCIRRRDRARRASAAAVHEEPALLVAPIPAPDAQWEREVDSPLAAVDQAYLLALLRAGSKAELARTAGVSRAAVTQRVQRILQRVAALSMVDRMAHEVWMTQQAAVALDADPELADRAAGPMPR